ncbi:cupin domain-containing protein [Luteimonas kalidii]|uniref:Cupin domain-containing protein n=1 Tax=Luteimonas kalidii TaxID=3042025 RepID=A0ABT6JYC4_9GAMM|nr:cupin domain-containing protein [Luteimonas kalidii]MDH5835577.1 cupin domain-containing protein [Luteimonas kalidii]
METLDPQLEIAQLIATLGLEPHPEGGYFRRFHESRQQVHVDGAPRPALTAIHYLLAPGERSRWHRVDADETWHWQQGGTLELERYDAANGALSRHRLAPTPAGDGTSCIVPAGQWQSAHAGGAAVLVVCTVAPGFVWEGFELLDPASKIGRELWRRGAVQR